MLEAYSAKLANSAGSASASGCPCGLAIAKDYDAARGRVSCDRRQFGIHGSREWISCSDAPVVQGECSHRGCDRRELFHPGDCGG